MNTECDSCRYSLDPKHLLVKTKHWQVVLGNDQVYLGRAYVTLRTYKGRLSELNPEEWADFQALVAVLEDAYRGTFGADPLNWACLMNNAYRVKPAHPHVHWHVFPRYKKAVEVAGIIFDDSAYGEHYDLHVKRDVDDEVVERILVRLKEHLQG